MNGMWARKALVLSSRSVLMWTEDEWNFARDMKQQVAQRFSWCWQCEIKERGERCLKLTCSCTSNIQCCIYQVEFEKLWKPSRKLAACTRSYFWHDKMFNVRAALSCSLNLLLTENLLQPQKEYFLQCNISQKRFLEKKGKGFCRDISIQRIIWSGTECKTFPMYANFTEGWA